MTLRPSPTNHACGMVVQTPRFGELSLKDENKKMLCKKSRLKKQREESRKEWKYTDGTSMCIQVPNYKDYEEYIKWHKTCLGILAWSYKKKWLNIT